MLFPSWRRNSKKGCFHAVIRKYVDVGWSPKFATRLNIRFTTTSGHFFANYMSIFHKTEVQTVILRCWTSLYLNWFKSYERNAKKRKNAKNAKNEEINTQITFFLQNWKKFEKEIFAFCVITFEPIKIIDLFSTSKWPSELQFCEK